MHGFSIRIDLWINSNFKLESAAFLLKRFFYLNLLFNSLFMNESKHNHFILNSHLLKVILQEQS